MNRSWAADRANLTTALTRLGRNARSSAEARSNSKGHDKLAGSDDGDEYSALLSGKKESGRTPLWLTIFPEGTITSDEERAKSEKYAKKEGIVSAFGSRFILCWAMRKLHSQ
jgi:1-acyl-sn-glycerol-3-phosphate acyltransferase